MNDNKKIQEDKKPPTKQDVEQQKDYYINEK